MSIFQRWLRPAPKPEGADEPIKREASIGLPIQSDQPITSIAQDAFDRASFARQIASVIEERQDPSSLVVGIYGPWGDGKTSALAMIKECLAAKEDVVTLDYNPWFYGANTEAITRSFFNSIKETLQKSGWFSKENIGDLMSKMGKVIPHVGEAVSAYGESMTTEALTATRDKVGAILRKHGKKIVVFVDDIDRLDRADIQTLFKLVRLSGGFDHATYVLAFDDEIVAEALGEAYGDGGAVAGRRFLEKIVQVPLHLPAASPQKLREMMFAGCDRVMAANGIELAEGENYELGSGLVSAFSEALRTPRQVKLVDNALTFAVPLLKGEVRVVDQMLIEALRVFYPSVYQAVRTNPDNAMKSRDRQGRGEPPLDAIDQAIERLEGSGSAKEAVKDLLETLFPRRSRMGYAEGFEERWSNEKRICSRDYFNRYFTYAVPTGDMSDLTIDSLIASAVQGHADAAHEIIELAMQRGASELLVRKLRVREDDLPTAAIPTIASAVARRAQDIPITGDIFLGDFTFRQAAILIAHLASRLTGTDQERVLLELAEQTPSLRFTGEIIRYCQIDPETRGRQVGFLEPERVQPLIAILLRRLKEATAKADLFEAAGDRFARLIYGIEKQGNDQIKGELKAFLAEILNAEPANTVRFLREFAGRTQGGNGAIGVSTFNRSSYEGVADLLDANQVYAQLRSTFGDELDKAEWYEDWDGLQGVDRRLADQFAYLHNHPQAGAAGED